jgi:H+/gluconate symporter-like permease
LIEISGKQKIAHDHLIVANARTIQGSSSSAAAVEEDGFAVTPTAKEKAALASVLSAVGVSGIGCSLIDENHFIHENASIK